jgi:hypothetical protein
MEAIYRLFKLQRGDKEGLLCALLLDRFPKAFETGAPQPDKRIVVPDRQMLRQIVKALNDGAESQLVEPTQMKWALAARKWLIERELEGTQKSACQALSKVDCPWQGLNPETLRDNVQRDPGARRRRAEAQRMTLLRAALRRTLDEVNASAPW